MADVKDILIRYGVDPGNSTKAMNDIAKASAVAGGALDKTGMSMKTNTQLGMNFNRVLQDSPYFFSSFNMGVMSVANNLPVLAESFQQARSRGETFKQMLGGMFTGMGGWITALNLVVSGILAYTLATRGAKEETEEFSGVFESMLSKMDSSQFKVDAKNAERAIVYYDIQIKKIQDIEKLREKNLASDLKTNQFGRELEIIKDNLTESEQKELAEAQKKLEIFQKLKLESQLRLKYAKELEAIGFEKDVKQTTAPSEKVIKVKGIKEKAGIDIGMGNSKEWAELEAFGDKYRKKQAESEAKLAQQKQTAIKDYYNTVKFADEDYYNYRRTKLNEELLGLQELGIAEEDLDILRKQRLDELESEKMASLRRVHQFENNFANAASATLRTGMNQAFDDIFGHANSLLEIFLQNLISGMAQDFATSAGEGIFSWLTGGASDIFSWFGLSKGDGGSRADSFIVTNVNIDGAVVAQAVTPYVASQQYERSRVKR